MPKEDGGRNSVEGLTQIKEDGESVPIRRCGGSADLLVGRETCTKRKGENNVGNKIKQRGRLQLRMRPSVRPSSGVRSVAPAQAGTIMAFIMIPAYANYLFLTTERRRRAKRVRKQPGADPACWLWSRRENVPVSADSCRRADRDKESFPFIILPPSLIPICNF